MVVSEHYVEVIAHRLGLDIDHVREVCLWFDCSFVGVQAVI
jgi:hypothetical protein